MNDSISANMNGASQDPQKVANENQETPVAMDTTTTTSTTTGGGVVVAADDQKPQLDNKTDRTQMEERPQFEQPPESTGANSSEHIHFINKDQLHVHTSTFLSSVWCHKQIFNNDKYRNGLFASKFYAAGDVITDFDGILTNADVYKRFKTKLQEMVVENQEYYHFHHYEDSILNESTNLTKFQGYEHMAGYGDETGEEIDLIKQTTDDPEQFTHIFPLYEVTERMRLRNAAEQMKDDPDKNHNVPDVVMEEQMQQQQHQQFIISGFKTAQPGMGGASFMNATQLIDNAEMVTLENLNRLYTANVPVHQVKRFDKDVFRIEFPFHGGEQIWFDTTHPLQSTLVSEAQPHSIVEQRVLFVAKHNIFPGDEITWNYEPIEARLLSQVLNFDTKWYLHACMREFQVHCEMMSCLDRIYETLEMSIEGRGNIYFLDIIIHWLRLLESPFQMSGDIPTSRKPSNVCPLTKFMACDLISIMEKCEGHEWKNLTSQFAKTIRYNDMMMTAENSSSSSTTADVTLKSANTTTTTTHVIRDDYDIFGEDFFYDDHANNVSKTPAAAMNNNHVEYKQNSTVQLSSQMLFDDFIPLSVLDVVKYRRRVLLFIHDTVSNLYKNMLTKNISFITSSTTLSSSAMPGVDLDDLLYTLNEFAKEIDSFRQLNVVKTDPLLNAYMCTYGTNFCDTLVRHLAHDYIAPRG